MTSAVTHLEDYDTEQRFKAIVVESERITPEASDVEVRELTLELQQPDFELQLGKASV
jgi:ferredoxin--NADP+ reductase